MESGFPRIRMLLFASSSMSDWLELLLWKCFTHPHPSISAAAFTHLHAICQEQEEDSSIMTDDDAQVVPPAARLTHAMILGPILTFFDDTSLYSPDKLRVSQAGTRAQFWRAAYWD